MRVGGWRSLARLDVLHERDFRLFFLGHVTSVLGTFMAPVAISFAVLREGGGPSEVGLVLMAQTVPLAVFMLAGGVIGDWLPRKVVMLTADLMRCASQAMLAFLLLTGSPSLVAFMALVGVLGLGSALFIPTEQGLIPQVTSAERLQDANALRGVANSLGRTVGPAIGGAIVAAAGPAWAIAADAATYGASAIFLARLPLTRAFQPARTSLLAGLRGGWHEFRSRTWLWATVTQIALVNMLVLAPFIVLGAVVADNALGGATSWGAILAAEGAGAVCGGLLMLHVRPARPLLVATLATFAFAPPLALLALHAPTTAVAAGAFLAGAGLGIWDALWYTTLQRETSPEAMARVTSYAALGSVAFLPLGYAITGPLSALLGVSFTLWLAVACLVVTTCFALALPSVRRLRGSTASGRASSSNR